MQQDQNLHARILKTLLAQGCHCPTDGIQSHHRLIEDLYCDDLDLVEISMCLEDEFKINIDDDEFAKVKTVQQLIDHITNVCTTEAA